MSREEAVDLYLQGRIDRRMFVRALGAAGVTVAAATTYSQVLAPGRAGAEPQPLGVLGADYQDDGVLKVLATWGGFGSGKRKFDFPKGIEYDDVRNRVYVADSGNHRIKKFKANGDFVDQWGGEGAQKGEFKFPAGVGVDRDTGNVYVADTESHRIQKFKSDGKFKNKWGTFGTGPGQFDMPRGVAVDASGFVYVADLNNNRVQKFSPDGVHQMDIPTGASSGPIDVAVDGFGDVYVAALYNHVIRKYDPSGNLIATGGTVGMPGPGHKHNLPAGVAVGIDYLYVVEAAGNRANESIRRLENNRSWRCRGWTTTPGVMA